MKISDFAARRFAHHRRFAAAATLLTFAACAASAAGLASDADSVTVQFRAVTPHLVAYAQVEPINILPVDAAEAGVVEELSVLPGMRVRAGQELAHLTGPGIRTLLMQDEADVRSDRSQLDAAQETLAVLREQLPSHLTTREAVHEAESADAQAQSALDNAQSRLGSVRQLMTLSAPSSGTVLALNSANGQLISAGQPVVTLQPDNQLWLRADYYGTDLKVIRPGMTGSFTPADGSAPVAVRVASIPGMVAVGGGESIALVPAGSRAAWISGESGTVTLDLPSRKLVAVPTRALVLNEGKWWVMVHTVKGDRPQQVVPGPAQGWDTLIESGLAPGTSVIVNNAYLLFHANVTEQFQIPD